MQALIAKAVGAFFVVALVLGLAVYGGWTLRDEKAEREALTAKNEHLEQLNKEREAAQGALNGISKEWQAYLARQSKTASGTVAKLRSDGIRLRVELADAKVAAVTGGSGPEPDGRAELSDRSSEFLIGQAQRADEQVKALQSAIHVLQQEGAHE